MPSPQIDKWQRKIFKVGRVFSPGAPVNEVDLFAGRAKQVDDIMKATTQRGQHVIIFGERGVGKTSLANVLSEFLHIGNGKGTLRSGSVNCDGEETFPRLWSKIMKELQVVFESEGVGFDAPNKEDSVRLDTLLPEDPTPEDVRRTLSHYAEGTVIIIDEVDRIEDERTLNLLVDTIKTLSDHSVDVTLVMVGVADSVSDLIGRHESIERALVQVRMPRMPEEELSEILQNGLDELDMSMASSAENRVITFSQGLPHYTHLLGLHSASAALKDKRTRVEDLDVRKATEQALDEAKESIRRRFHRAVQTSYEDTLFVPVLIACALAETDELGRFAASDVREPLRRITGEHREVSAFAQHLNDFSDDRGPVLRKIGEPRRYRYRFINPLMQPYAVMYGYSQGLIGDEILTDFR